MKLCTSGIQKVLNLCLCLSSQMSLVLLSPLFSIFSLNYFLDFGGTDFSVLISVYLTSLSSPYLQSLARLNYWLSVRSETKIKKGSHTPVLVSEWVSASADSHRMGNCRMWDLELYDK